MKKIFTLLLLSTLISGSLFAQFPTIYATLSSGSWATPAVFETFTGNATGTPGAQGSGTVATSVPSGTHFVFIRTGHTIEMGGANRACHSMTIQVGGKLWANEATARRLQLTNGGTGFLYPQTGTITNNGTIGGATDGIFFEAGTNMQNCTITGTGTTTIGRIRMPGGLASAASGVVNLIIDQDLFLTQAANYALSAVYNPAATDNYSITINTGKTVKTTAVDGFFHNSQNSATYGKYTYNIKGTLDLTANTSTTNNVSASIISPAPAAATITLNIEGGTLKLGAAFKADSSSTGPVSAGILKFNLLTGGIIDATNTANFKVGKTANGAGGFTDIVFSGDATSLTKQTVGATEAKFPVGILTATTPNTLSITNAGTADLFTVSIKGSIDNPLIQSTKVVNRQWNITEAVPGGSVAVLKFSWTTADQVAGFVATDPVVAAHWNGTSYDALPAVVTGTGTSADPYIATVAGVTSFSPFVIANLAALPVSFVNVRAFVKNENVQVEWLTASEINIVKYQIERSGNGRNFEAISSVEAKGSATENKYSFVDVSPFAGANYYRIKAIEKDAKVVYSTVVNVNTRKSTAEVVIAPNPVIAKKMTVQFNGFVKGNYTVELYSNDGRKVMSQVINHDGGSVTKTIILPSTVNPGTYYLQVNNGEVKFNKTVLVQ